MLTKPSRLQEKLGMSSLAVLFQVVCFPSRGFPTRLSDIRHDGCGLERDFRGASFLSS